MTTALAPVVHPNDEGPKFFFGKAYYWVKKNGRLNLLPWPDDAEGNPALYHLMPKEITT